MLNLSKIQSLVKILIVLVVVGASIPIVAFYNTTETKCFYIMLLLVTLWVTEVIPMPVTSLLPVIILPIFDIMSTEEVSQYYMNDIGLLLFGGWILAASFDESGLSKRIATNVLKFAGNSPFRLIMAYSMTAALMCMWFSNTVVTSMMITIAKAQFREFEKNAASLTVNDFDKNASTTDLVKTELSIISNSTFDVNEKRDPETPHALKRLFKATLLSVVYGANVGGAATLTGSISNLILVDVVGREFPEEKTLTFANFLIYGVVSMVIDVVIGVLVLWWFFIKPKNQEAPLNLKSDCQVLKTDPVTYKEVCVAMMSLLVIFLFIFKSSSFVTGWEETLGNNVKIKEATPLVLAVFLLLILPKNPKKLTGDRLFTWKELEKQVPFGIILVIGGILSLSGILEKSGITYFLSEVFQGTSDYDPQILLLVLCLTCTFITEVASSLLVVLVFLPIIGNLAVSAHVNPLFFMLPAAVSTSYAFMLPVATIPNTVAAQEGEIAMLEMAVPGFFMNLFAFLVQYGLANSLGNALFSFHEIPHWLELRYANATNTTFLP